MKVGVCGEADNRVADDSAPIRPDAILCRIGYSYAFPLLPSIYTFSNTLQAMLLKTLQYH